MAPSKNLLEPPTVKRPKIPTPQAGLFRHSAPRGDAQMRYGSIARRTMSAVEASPQFVHGNVAGCLPDDSAQSAGVELGVIGNGECLPLVVLSNTPQLHMASLLGLHVETE